MGSRAQNNLWNKKKLEMGRTLYKHNCIKTRETIMGTFFFYCARVKIFSVH